MGKRARERRRRERRLALIQGGRSEGHRAQGARRVLEHPGVLIEQAVARARAIMDSRAPAEEAAEEILDVFGDGVAPFSILGGIHARSPERARAIAEAALALSPGTEAALGLAVAVAEADDDPGRALALMHGRVGRSSHPMMRAALGRALNAEGRIAEAAEVLEPLCLEHPGFAEAEEERGYAVIAAHVRVETDGTWPCPCGSGRAYAACCGPRERAVVERFLDRSSFDRFRARLFAYSMRPAFEPMRARAWFEWFGEEPPPSPEEPPDGEARTMIERACLVVPTSGEPGVGDSILERFATDLANARADRRRAEDWARCAQYGLWRVTGEAEPPGVHLEDLLTGAAHYVAVAVEQRDALETGGVVLGLVVPFDGVWRTGSALFPMTLQEADRLRDALLEQMIGIEREAVPGAGGELAARLEELRASLQAGRPPAELPADLSFLLPRAAAAGLPRMLDLLGEIRAGPVVLTNTSGEPLELITARIGVGDLAGVRERLLARDDIRPEPDEAEGLVWEGDPVPPDRVAEMHAQLREQGVEVVPDEAPPRWILGHIRVEADALVLEVNSRARLRRFLVVLEEVGAGPCVLSEEATPAPQPPGASETLAWLHPAEPLPERPMPVGEELVRAAAASTVLTRMRSLLDLLGETGRKLTATGRLRLADARALAEAIGIEFDERFGDRVYRPRSAADVRPIEETVAWARAAGVVRLVHGWARPTRRAAYFDRDPLADWWRLFESFVGTMRWPERRRRGERPWWGEEVSDLIPRYLEEVYRAGGEPVAASTLAERTVGVLALRYRIEADEERRALAEWIEGDIAYGLMRPLAELGALALVEEPVVLGEKPTGWTSISGARSTPLGLWAIRRLLTGRA
jgi:hypothetical protein